ncbi:MAG: 4Fe-4S binding protein [Bacillota bacterium]|nr:4Fe-4S binding protein [Bacillota bacterium]
MWIAHICFSPCGETKRIADHFYRKCGGVFYDFTDPAVRDGFDLSVRYQLIVLSLPVYSESIPDVMKPWLKRFHADRYVLNLAYGGKAWGDAAAIAAECVGSDKVIAWSVTTVKHCYCERAVEIDFSLYDPIIAKINGGELTPCPVKHVRSNPFAHFFPKKRARFNVAISIDLTKCVHCGECVKKCPVKAITPEPAVTKECIRCGLCPKLCPVGAIKWTMSPLLVNYLKNRKTAGAVIRTR